MKILYKTNKIEKVCRNKKEALNFFSGDKKHADCLMARINLLESAQIISDIIVLPFLHFHNLHNKKGNNLEGFFAIDIVGRSDKWRLILQPLDENEKEFIPCNIDKVAKICKNVKIMEVSNHYE